MARRRKSNREEAKTPKGNNKTGTIALLLIVAVMAVLVWGAFRLKTPSVDVEDNVQLPAYAYISARSEESYRAAISPEIQFGDAFSDIPCYCGCVNVGHTSLKDCFIDAHGSMCDVCQFEALETYEMVNKGVPIAQIRDTIDARYGDGRFAPGTDTPAVA